jgi:hypothetical protein
MQPADAYIPFVRQIMDWYRFCQNGYGITVDPYISIDITTRQPVAVDRLQAVVQTLLTRHDVLRTQFRLAPDGLLYQVRLDPASPRLQPRLFAGATEQAFATMVQDNEAHSIHNSVLFKVCLVVSSPVSCIRLYAHHLIADPRSLALLKQEFVAAYRATSPLPPVPPSSVYATYKNQRLLARYTTDLAFLKSRFAPLDRAIFATNVPAPTTPAACLRRLCAEPYHHFGTRPGHSYYSALPMPPPAQLTALLRQHQTSLVLLLLITFARVCRAIGLPQSLIGVLYNDGFSPQARHTVGHFMGESFIGIDPLTEAHPQQLGSWQQQLFGLYKHAIYNYNLYGIDEAALYRHCVGFLNYSEADTNLNPLAEQPFFQAIDTVHFDLDPSFCYYQNHLRLWWRFNKNAFTNGQIIDIDARFRAELTVLLHQLQLALPGPAPHTASQPAGGFVE